MTFVFMCMLVVVVVILVRGLFDARVCHYQVAFSLARGVLRSVSVLRFGTRAAVIVALSFGVVSCLPLVFCSSLELGLAAIG